MPRQSQRTTISAVYYAIRSLIEDELPGAIADALPTHAHVNGMDNHDLRALVYQHLEILLNHEQGVDLTTKLYQLPAVKDCWTQAQGSKTREWRELLPTEELDADMSTNGARELRQATRLANMETSDNLRETTRQNLDGPVELTTLPEPGEDHDMQMDTQTLPLPPIPPLQPELPANEDIASLVQSTREHLRRAQHFQTILATDAQTLHAALGETIDDVRDLNMEMGQLAHDQEGLRTSVFEMATQGNTTAQAVADMARTVNYMETAQLNHHHVLGDVLLSRAIETQSRRLIATRHLSMSSAKDTAIGLLSDIGLDCIDFIRHLIFAFWMTDKNDPSVRHLVLQLPEAHLADNAQYLFNQWYQRHPLPKPTYYLKPALSKEQHLWKQDIQLCVNHLRYYYGTDARYRPTNGGRVIEKNTQGNTLREIPMAELLSLETQPRPINPPRGPLGKDSEPAPLSPELFARLKSCPLLRQNSLDPNAGTRSLHPFSTPTRGLPASPAEPRDIPAEGFIPANASKRTSHPATATGGSLSPRPQQPERSLRDQGSNSSLRRDYRLPAVHDRQHDQAAKSRRHSAR
ncbi:hypothetical protein BJ508DRAFT_333091 [Ascobolus immersus RN42]|uniref:Uncharacterized protein n=1 Tax=Ascobolus immersus RN42 TaxID=1160509 RepID=A0A3N4HKS1_ASCIM|nr:hypothetical protein BJ508DRAFT_333091 [Ascobolus immersus RN42]